MERQYVLVERGKPKLISYKVFTSLDDARVERHALEIHNAGLIIDIMELTPLQVNKD